RPVDAIDQDVGVKDSCIPFEGFTETFRNPYRRAIFRMDQTYDVRLIEFIEPIFKRPARGLCCVAFPPKLSLQRPANFKPGPAFRINTTNATNQASALFFLNRPNTIAAEIPMPDHRSHMAPGLRTIEYFSAEVTHHLRVSAQFRIRFEVGFAPHAQDEAFRFQRYLIH